MYYVNMNYQFIICIIQIQNNNYGSDGYDYIITYVLCEYKLQIHNMYHLNPKQQLRKEWVRLHLNV